MTKILGKNEFSQKEDTRFRDTSEWQSKNESKLDKSRKECCKSRILISNVIEIRNKIRDEILVSISNTNEAFLIRSSQSTEANHLLKQELSDVFMNLLQS